MWSALHGEMVRVSLSRLTAGRLLLDLWSLSGELLASAEGLVTPHGMSARCWNAWGEELHEGSSDGDNQQHIIDVCEHLLEEMLA
ncbi:MAG: hypothetical protein ACI8S6_005506 [Myxococcota bacterium]|jgi:hypothetical protein